MHLSIKCTAEIFYHFFARMNHSQYKLTWILYSDTSVINLFYKKIAACFWDLQVYWLDTVIARLGLLFLYQRYKLA